MPTLREIHSTKPSNRNTSRPASSGIRPSLGLRSNPAEHLAFFQSLGMLLQRDPIVVIESITQWFSEDTSPRYWFPFAYSIRGFAFEEIDDYENARGDYAMGLKLYKQLERGGMDVKRLEGNVSFTRFRLRTIGGVEANDSDSGEEDDGSQIPAITVS